MPRKEEDRVAKPKIPIIAARCEAVRKDNAATLYIYGTIARSSWWDDDVVSASTVKEALEEIGEVEEIRVYINSGGGDVFESIAIMNQLKQHSAKIQVMIDGLAASGASIVAMAGDEIKMSPSSMMMVHKAWSFAVGNADDFRKLAEDMDKIDSAVFEAYKPRFQGEDEDLRALISNETWLTAAECLDMGFCTALTEKTPAEDPEDVKNSILERIRAQAAAKKQPQEEKKSILENFKKGEKE